MRRVVAQKSYASPESIRAVAVLSDPIFFVTGNLFGLGSSAVVRFDSILNFIKICRVSMLVLFTISAQLSENMH